MSLSTSTDVSGHSAFAALPKSAASHFRLCFLGAVLQVTARLARNLGYDELLEQFPFLRDYLDELESLGSPPSPEPEAVHEWHEAVRRWERGVESHLPIASLRQALSLDERAISILFAVGLIEEDPRFGFVIECAQPVSPQQHRPTLGLLTSWWHDDDGAVPARECIRLLLDHGVIQVLNADAPRLQWLFQSPPAAWDALRDEMPEAPAPAIRFSKLEALPALGDIILAEPLRRSLEAVPRLLEGGDARALIIRGPQHNGRRTIAKAIAAALGRGVLEVRGPLRPDDPRWPLVGALATLGNAVPLIVLDLALGETCELPVLRGFTGPVAVILGKHGAVAGPGVEGALAILVDMPGALERRELWQQSLAVHEPGDPELLAGQFRMTSGNIRTAAGLARSYALLAGRRRIGTTDVRVASRSLHRELETLATFIPATGGWESIGAAPETIEELRNLEARCRHREELREHVGVALGRQLNCGVRALFGGPSGTGKTMAARLLAATLEMDLYRLDLASVVNKYIGETEKTLDQLFSRAEELAVVLLIDEGDALLTSRTAVQSSNDRYANLETNFLLQRLESYEGILVVTTNAANRIDSAFQRRMDVVVEFRMPEPHERWAIWQLHLPASHAIEHGWLQDVALRCEMSGGQIRNAVLHASLLALDDRRPLGGVHLERALHREYRKSGAVCPLPRSWGA